MKNLFLLSIALLIAGNVLYAQTGIRGKVVDTYGEPLIGATIVSESNKGGISDLNGKFRIEMSAGKKNLTISYVGYDTKTMTVDIPEGKIVNLGDIALSGSTIGLGSINIIADRAKERETPVAISNITKTELKQQLGSRDIPLVMNLTPSVYSTQQGGGAGDARINVRGFNQRNVAIMINGVPINDMENGWVYWSNWDGIADATSSIQMQRGLSAVNLATPSIGGTMNVITSPTERKAGGSARFEYGSGKFMKTTVSGHSGLINDKFAVSASLVRKVGEGVIDATWTDAWAYYFGASYIVAAKHRLEVYALGAPQRHGQNLYKQNVATYDQEYAKELGAVQGTLDAFKEMGREYNQNWQEVDESYNGKQYWNGKEHDRYDKSFINERENFYHKPLVNLNWYSQWTDNIYQFTTVYYSGGNGGGTGTYGDVYRRDADGELGDDDYEFYYGRSPWQWDWNEMIDANAGSADQVVAIDKDTIARESGESVGILRNSRNNQWTIGAISKVKIDFTDNLRASAGVDWRTAEIEHFREIRDLLGGDFYTYTGNAFDSGNDYKKVRGDKIAYNFTNTVDWLGYFAQIEYSSEQLTAYATLGNSYIKYSYTNHFAKKEGTNNELTAESDFITGWQVKGGLSYRPVKEINIFANYGFISKAPIFDNIISDRSGVVAQDPQNEVFNAFEAGASYQTPSKNAEVKANFYYTKWTDRAMNIGIRLQSGEEGYVFVQGMNQLHRGFELEGSVKPIPQIGFGFMASFANWEYINDVSGEYKDYENPSETQKYNYYVDGLKVGDAPQMQFAAVLKAHPVKNSLIQIDWRHYSNHYADWDPFSRTDETDDAQVWKTPAYMVFDVHASYTFILKRKYHLEMFAHIFNLLDEKYIQDAVDNSQYNGYDGENGEYSHDVNTAEVFMGLPRTFNVGLQFSF